MGKIQIDYPQGMGAAGAVEAPEDLSNVGWCDASAMSRAGPTGGGKHGGHDIVFYFRNGSR